MKNTVSFIGRFCKRDLLFEGAYASLPFYSIQPSEWERKERESERKRKKEREASERERRKEKASERERKKEKTSERERKKEKASERETVRERCARVCARVCVRVCVRVFVRWLWRQSIGDYLQSIGDYMAGRSKRIVEIVSYRLGSACHIVKCGSRFSWICLPYHIYMHAVSASQHTATHCVRAMIVEIVYRRLSPHFENSQILESEWCECSLWVVERTLVMWFRTPCVRERWGAGVEYHFQEI